MLIRDSYITYVFVRTAITALRLIAPASIAYCLILALLRPREFSRHPLPSIWATAESAFYLVVYLPLKRSLQRQALHPTPPPKDERKVLFRRCLDSIAQPEFFLSGWFLGASIGQIRRENVKEFYAWSFMNKKYEVVDEAENAELDCYVEQFQDKFNLEFEGGRGAARSLRGTVDGVLMQHRPLVWYLIIGLVDLACHARLLLHGYSFHRASVGTCLTMLPFRPLSFFGSASSPLPKVSYWYREHTSKHRLPVLFVHGVGVGMYAYLSFLLELSQRLSSENDEGDVGLIALEILPVSARICTPALAADDMRSEIRKILQRHHWKEFVLVGHSYGSAVAASIIRDPDDSKLVKAAVLMDPICFLLHWPDVAYNFTRRKPNTASEYMLHYFSSQDMMISHTLARRFFWNQYILWKEDIQALPLTVTLSGKDIIVPSKAVRDYLIPDLPPAEGRSDAMPDDETVERQSELMQVIWFPDFNHADVFDSKGATRGVVNQIHEYCGAYGSRHLVDTDSSGLAAG